MKRLSSPIEIPQKPHFRGISVDTSFLVPGYDRNLPHFRFQNATYFVTFRLADSIPKHVAAEWNRTRDEWLESHGINPKDADTEHSKEAYRKIPAKERYAFERKHQQQFYVELDKCHGSCVLEHAEANVIVANALEYFHGQRIWCGDYVVMPNHVHLLVQPFPGIKLEEWLYSIKKYSSYQLGKARYFIDDNNSKIQKRKHLWQVESYDHVVRDAAELARIRRYIANNPRKLRPGTFIWKRMKWLDEFAGLVLDSEQKP